MAKRTKKHKYKVGDYVNFLPNYETYSDQHDEIDSAISGKTQNKFKVCGVYNSGAISVYLSNEETDWYVYTESVIPYGIKPIIIISNETKPKHTETSKV